MKPEWEIRSDKEGNFDEVIAEDAQFVHLERMDKDHFWLGITLQDGSRITANLYINNGVLKLSAEREEL
jgi:hypothetical protein